MRLQPPISDIAVMSGTKPPKILMCLTCPAITACVMPGVLEDLQEGAELADRHPVQVGLRRSAAAASSSSFDASSLMPMMVTSWPSARAASSTRNGNRPLPAMMAELLCICAFCGVILGQSSVFFPPRRRITPRDAVRMKSTRLSTSGHFERRVLLDAADRLRRVELRLRQVAIGGAQLLQRVVGEAAALEADQVQAEHARRPAADRAPVRQRVLGDHRVAADERIGADAAELVHRRPGADVDEVGDRHVAAERRVRAEDRLVADVAVVRHVHVIHEQVAVADRRHAAAAGGAAVDRDELAEDVAGADLEAGRLARYFRSCGASPIDAYGNTSVPSPIVVWPSITDDAPILQLRPMRTCGPITANAPTMVPAPITAVGDDARERIDVRDRRTAPAAARLRPPSARRLRRPPSPSRAGRAMAPSVTIELQLIAGDDVLAELGAVNAAQLHAAARRCRCSRRSERVEGSSSSSVAACASASIISTAGISGLCGNVPGRNLR